MLPLAKYYNFKLDYQQTGQWKPAVKEETLRDTQVNNKTVVYLRAGKDRMRLCRHGVEKEIRTGMSIMGSRIQKVISSMLTPSPTLKI